MAKGRTGTTSRKIKTSLHHHGERDMSYIKPKKFRNHVTITELARIVNRDTSRIRQLEKDGRIPEAVRVERGTQLVRLWSPAQVEEIKGIFASLRPGRPRG